MTAKEREFLCEIMWLALMQRGKGMQSKSPAYIQEKMQRKQDPMAMWQGIDDDAKALVRDYFYKWEHNVNRLNDMLSEIQNDCDCF